MPMPARYARSRNTFHRTNRKRHANPARPAMRKNGPTELFVRYARPAETLAMRIHFGSFKLFRMAATVTTKRRATKFSAYPVPVVVMRTGSRARRAANHVALSGPKRSRVATKKIAISAIPATRAATWTAMGEYPSNARKGARYAGYAGG